MRGQKVEGDVEGGGVAMEGGSTIGRRLAVVGEGEVAQELEEDVHNTTTTMLQCVYTTCTLCLAQSHTIRFITFVIDDHYLITLLHEGPDSGL